ncbi:unnamed protein product, partial [Rotaria magnacalcarata]
LSKEGFSKRDFVFEEINSSSSSSSTTTTLDCAVVLPGSLFIDNYYFDIKPIRLCIYSDLVWI